MMNNKNLTMASALRETAERLALGSTYQWGHMGSCNCGHLAQTITTFSKGKIHGAAMWRHGDWREQLRDYCPQSGLPLDQIIDEMLDMGFSRGQLAHLERLSDPTVLTLLPPGSRNLRHNVRADVVLYLTTWAALLEAQRKTEAPARPHEPALMVG